MTRKEWMKEHHPETIGQQFWGGVDMCPHSYEDLPDNNSIDTCKFDFDYEDACYNCWNKEMKVNECQKEDITKK